jgi:tRNA uridine 5-carbamoylmethylation protein Kti12
VELIQNIFIVCHIIKKSKKPKEVEALPEDSNMVIEMVPNEFQKKFKIVEEKALAQIQNSKPDTSSPIVVGSMFLAGVEPIASYGDEEIKENMV